MSVRTSLLFACWLWLMVIDFPATAEQPFSFASTPGKLPKSVVPHHYVVQIEPDLRQLTTRGTVTVDIEVLKPVKEILLNAVDLNVTKATLLGTRTIALKSKSEPQNQLLWLKSSGKILPGHYQLQLQFIGKLNEQAEGFFYAKYPTSSGEKVMLATQMEPTDARQLFPCWDEPAFRATFEMDVILPDKFKAFSNMPVESENQLAGGMKEVKFTRTPPMSSYLVALVAGELEELHENANGVDIRVVTTEGKAEQGRYALEATKKLLAYYNDYFGIKYPLPKLDQIAIPGGFSGAMENWGAITYSESELLYDPKSSSPQTQREVFVTVAHEMAHQWFGDLVTMGWWDNLWLNEGFATWMETKATDHFNPDWQLWLSADAEKSAVMSSDARRPTHPIQQVVSDEGEANDAFDDITYQKGGAFLRMLEDYLGEESFRQGLHHYLSTHSYSNTTTADLWNALTDVSGKPIHSLAGGWTEQPGVPLVKVQAECVNSREMVSLRQERLTVDRPRAKSEQWEIPISLMPVSDPNAVLRTLLKGASNTVALAECNGATKVNAGDIGYYRVWYSPALFSKLSQSVQQLPTADRFNLLDDCWAMVEAQRMGIEEYFTLANSLNQDKANAIWDQILSSLEMIDALEQGQPGHRVFQDYACRLLRPQFHRLGWEHKPGETVNDGLLRGKIIAGLGHFGDAAVIAEAKELFEKFVAAPETLPPDLRPAVLQIVGRFGDKRIYDQILTLARHANGTEERQLYYNALCSALDPELARTTLGLSLSNELSPEEASGMVLGVAGNTQHTELAWEFANQHLRELLGKVEAFSRNSYVPAIFSSFSDTARAAELERYAKKLSEDAQVKADETATEIRFKAAFKKRELPIIDHWITTQTNNTK